MQQAMPQLVRKREPQARRVAALAIDNDEARFPLDGLPERDRFGIRKLPQKRLARDFQPLRRGHIRPDDRIAARGQDFQRMHGQCRNAAANQHTICHCRGAGHPIILLHRRSARGRQGRTRWRTAPCRPQDTSPAPPASSGGKRGT